MKTKSFIAGLFLTLCTLAPAATNDLAGALQRGLFEEEANRNLDAAAQAYQTVSTQFDKDRALAATAIFRLGEIYRKQNKTNEAVVQYERIVREFADQNTLVTLGRQNLAGLRSSPQPTSAVSANASELNADAQLLAKLKTLSRSELREVLPGISNDKVLPELIQQLNTADLQFASRARDISESHPEYQRILSTQKLLNEKIEDRIDGILKGMEIRSRAQVASTPTATAAALSLSSRTQLLQLLQEEIALVEKKLEGQRNIMSSGRVSQADLLSTQQELLALKRQLVTVADDSAGGGSTSAGKDSAATASEVSNYEEQEIRRLQALIRNSPDLINGPTGAESPLYRAAGAGQLRVATFLLDNGADANRVSLGRTPLHNAVDFGHKGMVELLLQRGANVEARDATGGTALHLAAQNGFLSIAELLLKYKADLNARNSQSNGEQTPLHLAVKGGHRVMSEFLVERGADVNATSSSGASPVFTAVWSDQPGLLARLLALGAKPDLVNDSGRTALSYAAERGQVESVKALLVAKADPNAGRKDLPLHSAIHSRAQSPTLVEMLLRAGADANRITRVSSWGDRAGGGTKGSYTGAPLEAAINEGNVEIVKLLLQFKADPNGPSSTGEPMVVRVAKNPPLLRLLLEAGANPNAVRPDFDGAASALHTAVVAPANPESASLLLEHGAKPNVTAHYGQRAVTPLMLAANGKDAKLVQLLLGHKADPNLRDVVGNTALLNGVRGQAVEVVRALLAGGANPDITAADGYPALTLAVTDYANRDVTAELLAAKANVNAPDLNGKTPLHWAVEKRRTDLTELLLKAGADVNLRDKSGLTPLDYAKQSNPSLRPVAWGMPQSPAPLPPLPTSRAVSPAAGTQPAAEATATDVAALLRQHGALDELPRLDRIEVRRASANYSATAFEFGTNKWNQFTLLEVIAWQYGFVSTERNATWVVNQSTVPSSFWGKSPCPFPDLDRVLIRRSESGKTRWTETVVNVAAALDSGDCARDVILQPGDVVEIPEMDHPVNEKWAGLADVQLSNLLHCVSRRVAISVKGTANTIQLAPRLTATGSLGPYGEGMKVLTKGSFMLKSVLAQSRLVRASSDMSRVKVTRRANGKTQEWVMDCSSGQDPNFWLRDGDAIEVPDRP